MTRRRCGDRVVRCRRRSYPIVYRHGVSGESRRGDALPSERAPRRDLWPDGTTTGRLRFVSSGPRVFARKNLPGGLGQKRVTETEGRPFLPARARSKRVVCSARPGRHVGSKDVVGGLAHPRGAHFASRGRPRRPSRRHTFIIPPPRFWGNGPRLRRRRSPTLALTHRSARSRPPIAQERETERDEELHDIEDLVDRLKSGAVIDRRDALMDLAEKMAAAHRVFRRVHGAGRSSSADSTPP